MVDIFNQFTDFKSFEVVFRTDEKELQKVFCTVKSIENNSIVLNANNQKNKNILIKVGTPLQLYIYTDNGVYSSSSKLLLATPGIINTEYVITYPTNSKHSQRREFFRADIPVPFEITTFLNGVENSPKIKGKARNVCGRGMSYIDDKQFADADKIHIEMVFEDLTVTTFAELVYSQSVLIKGVPKFIHAFVFTDISKKNIDYVIKKCFLHQLDLKKKPS